MVVGEVVARRVPKLLAMALLTGLSLTHFAQAQTESTASPRPLVGEGSSFTLLAREVARLPIGTPSLVVVGPVQSRAQGGSVLSPEVLKELHAQLRATVASVIPLAKRRESAALSPQEARALARKERLPLVYFSPEMSGGELKLEVSVTAWPTSFWQRAKAPEGATTASLKLTVPADSAIRRLFPIPKELLAKTTKVPSPVVSPLALACGDLDGDERNDVLVVGRTEVALGHFSLGKFITTKRHAWSDLSPVAAAPLRAPLAGAAIHQGRAIVGLSDRADLLAFDSNLNPVSFAPRMYPLNYFECALFSGTGIAEKKSSCGPFSAKRSEASVPSDHAGLDAWTEGTVTTNTGTLHSFSARLRPGETSVEITLNSASLGSHTKSLGETGASLVWADLDGDGEIELLSSGVEDSKGNDELRVHSINDKGARPRATAAGGPVRAITACPFGGSNPLPVVAAVAEELWLLE